MSSTTFVDQVTPVPASWLNDVNTATYTSSSVPSLTALTSVNGGQLAGLRNRIINGGMQIAQRGSVAVALGSFIYGGADRMVSGLFGFTTASATMTQLLAPGTSTGYWQQLTNITTTGAGFTAFYHRTEASNCQDLAGKAVTISVLVYQDSGAAQNVFLQFNKANAPDNFGSSTTLYTSGNTSVPNATVTRVTFTIPALTALDVVNGVQLSIVGSMGAVTNKNFQAGDWQFELGSVATPFEQRPTGLTLALCQRYYEILPNIQFVAYSSSGNYIGQTYPFKVTKRAVPTVSGTSSYANTSGMSATPSIDGIYTIALVTALGAASWQYTNVSASAEL